MRDPKRIREFLNEFADIWERNCPDWRFGQLICNVFGEYDPFYYEEDKALDIMRKYFNE